jgi:hypothetical protein
LLLETKKGAPLVSRSILPVLKIVSELAAQ